MAWQRVAAVVGALALLLVAARLSPACADGTLLAQVVPAEAAKPAPELVFPSSGAVLDNGRRDQTDEVVWEFGWTDVDGAERYHLWVCRPGASAPTIDHFCVPASHWRYVSTDGIPEGLRVEWTWRVRAYCANGWTPWSALGIFQVEPIDTDPPSLPAPARPVAPQLLAPAPDAVLDNGRTDGADATTWDFDWTDSPGATRYHLYVIGRVATIPVIDRSDIAASSWRREAMGGHIIETNRRGWTWWVRAGNADGWGPWSAPRVFDVEPANTDPPVQR